jgi:hypothetical protein
MNHDLDDLASASDIAAVLGVVPSAITNWRRRSLGFPEPLVVVANGTTPLFSAKAVGEWYRQRKPELKRDAERIARLRQVMS